MDLIVKDKFFADADALRADVLGRGFSDVVNPTDGITYTGIQLRDSEEFQAPLSALVGFPVRVRTSVARINFAGELPDNAVHSDHAMGEFAAVGYLTPKNSPPTGTAFWTDKQTGWEEMPAEADASVIERLRGQANVPTAWNANALVFARPGRLIAYPTKRFHSRYPFNAFGTTPETARLILAIFFDRV